jgi:hypothetical protein
MIETVVLARADEGDASPAESGTSPESRSAPAPAPAAASNDPLGVFPLGFIFDNGEQG